MDGVTLFDGGRPRIIYRDGLPHCARCPSTDDLCAYHRRQIETGLSQLKTANRTNALSPMTGLRKQLATDD